MHHLTSVEDILDLIENQIPEGIHLDYKASDALSTKKKSEIAKDVWNGQVKMDIFSSGHSCFVD